jgi:hypothetical protein
MANGHGGKRAGSRPPKPGYKWKSTLAKIEAREQVRKMITEALGPMLRSQIAHSQGIGHLFTRDKTGKFTRIENEDEALLLLNNGTEGEHYWIFMKDPSVQAFTELLDRALDQAAKPIELSGAGGGPIVVKWAE